MGRNYQKAIAELEATRILNKVGLVKIGKRRNSVKRTKLNKPRLCVLCFFVIFRNGLRRSAKI